MDDPSTKKQVAIPDWQKNYTGSPSVQSQDSASNQKSQNENPVQPQSQLVDDARRFLADESIRNASRERKVAFLEKKGLQGDEIQRLLGPEESLPSPSQQSGAAEMKTVHDSTTTPSAKDEPQALSTSPTTPSSEARPAAPSRDTPPIITYPEFLLRPQKPPPLVTFQRLAYAIYALAGVSTLTYGASKYLVQPMLESLTDARHDLAETTLADLQKLNSKLEANVSHIPVMASSALHKKKPADADEDEVESIDSDPTELFHRDMATQTSPPHSRSSSFSSSSINLSGPHKSTDATAKQAARLSSLHSSLSTLNSSTSTSFSSDALKESISEFQSLLDSIQINHNPYNSEFSSIYPSTSSGAADKKKKKPAEAGAEAAKFKAEIRALKGALLGARQFPVARPAVGYTGGGGGGSAVGVK